MHERSLVQSLLTQVESLIANSDSERVLEINVSIGDFAGVERDLFEMAFEEMVADSVARGARLNVHPVPLEARCDACDQSFPIVDFKFQCRQCGNRNVSILRGEEILLESLVVEQPSE